MKDFLAEIIHVCDFYNGFSVHACDYECQCLKYLLKTLFKKIKCLLRKLNMFVVLITHISLFNMTGIFERIALIC